MLLESINCNNYDFQAAKQLGVHVMPVRKPYKIIRRSKIIGYIIDQASGLSNYVWNTSFSCEYMCARDNWNFLGKAFYFLSSEATL